VEFQEFGENKINLFNDEVIVIAEILKK